MNNYRSIILTFKEKESTEFTLIQKLMQKFNEQNCSKVRTKLKTNIYNHEKQAQLFTKTKNTKI